MKMFSQKLQSSFVVALAIISIAGVSYTFAAPTQPPSSGAGVELPLHVGSAAQVKGGDLTINGTLSANGQICVNGTCTSSFSTAAVTTGTASASVSGNLSVNCPPGDCAASGRTYVGDVVLSGSGALVSAAPSGVFDCQDYFISDMGGDWEVEDVTVEVINPTGRVARVTVVCTETNNNNYCSAGGGWGSPTCSGNVPVSGTISGVTVQ